MENSEPNTPMTTLSYNFVAMNPPDSWYTEPASVNNNGQVIGFYRTTSQSSGDHGFLWAPGNMITLDAPWATNGTYPQAINDSGVIVGIFYDALGMHGFTWDQGQWAKFDVHGTVFGTQPVAINQAGQIAGNFNSPIWGNCGFLRDGSDEIILKPTAQQDTVNVSAINTSGIVAGTIIETGRTTGFIYESGTYTYLDQQGPLAESNAWGINDHGEVVGTCGPPGAMQGFLYSGGVGGQTTFFLAPGAIGEASLRAINNAGDIVLQHDSSDHTGIRTDCYVRRGGILIPLLPPYAKTGSVTMENRKCLNDIGQVVGTFHSGRNFRGFVASP